MKGCAANYVNGGSLPGTMGKNGLDGALSKAIKIHARSGLHPLSFGCPHFPGKKEHLNISRHFFFLLFRNVAVTKVQQNPVYMLLICFPGYNISGIQTQQIIYTCVCIRFPF